MDESTLIDNDNEVGRERFEAVIRSVPDAIVAIDPRGSIDFMNPAAEELFGYGSDDALGRAFAALLAEPHQSTYAAHMREHARGETIPEIGLTKEVIGRKSDGSDFAMELTITDLRPMEQRMLVAVARDIRDRLRAEADLREAADHDPLTGLVNRHTFERDLTRHIRHSERYGEGGSVIEIGIDDFGAVVSTRGPEAGNDVLRRLAELLTDRLRTTDQLARVAEDEFAVLVHGAAGERASEVARELVLTIASQDIETSSGAVHVTASAGVAELGGRPITGVELLAEAEGAMRSAKELGPGSVVDLAADAESQAGMDAERMWSERGMFLLACQPVLDVETGKIAQHELLLRVRGEGGELMLPGVFLATAERFGLIGAVDRWVAREAIRLVAAHAAENRDLVIEVNLSSRSLADEGFPAHVARELEATGIDPSLVIFEASERDLRDDLERSAKLARELTDLGCRFALDDFGAGVGSLMQLKELPLSFVKIDGHVMANAADSPADRAIVAALVALCRELGVETIAEVVEDDRTLTAADQLGVDFAQGNFLGHPHPVADLADGI